MRLAIVHFLHTLVHILVFITSLAGSSSSWGLHVAGKSWTMGRINFRNVLNQFGSFIAPVLCWTKESTLLNLSFLLLTADDQDLELLTALGTTLVLHCKKTSALCIVQLRVARVTFVVYICSFVLLAKFSVRGSVGGQRFVETLI